MGQQNKQNIANDYTYAGNVNDHQCSCGGNCGCKDDDSHECSCDGECNCN